MPTIRIPIDGEGRPVPEVVVSARALDGGTAAGSRPLDKLYVPHKDSEISLVWGY